MKVLVIDDDPDIVEVVSLTFEMRWPDSTIVSAPDGDTGIQMVDTESPALVILDIGLPDMDGYTVCQEIRRFSDVPIIMVTVRDKEADIVKGLQLGADDYVAKPFRPIEFMARVQSVLRRTQMTPYSGEELHLPAWRLDGRLQPPRGAAGWRPGQANSHRVSASIPPDQERGTGLEPPHVAGPGLGPGVSGRDQLPEGAHQAPAAEAGGRPGGAQVHSDRAHGGLQVRQSGLAPAVYQSGLNAV